MHTCQSKRHTWIDPECAKYCCNPDYVPVRGVSRQELEKENAVAIRPVAGGMMFDGFVRTPTAIAKGD